jgi:MoxR-like ATPase
VASTEPLIGLSHEHMESASGTATALVDALAQAVRTPRSTLEACVVCLASGGHLMIEDVPGVGKTVLAKSLARAAGCGYGRVQCTADLLPADITGVSVWHQGEAEFRFHPGPVFANLLLVDEINRASPKTQSALLECMEEGQVTVDGATRSLPAPFMVIATQNPIEYEGTFPLPEAQLDRFTLRVAVGYPGATQEAEMIVDLSARDPLDAVPQVTDEAGIRALMSAVASIHVDRALADYVVGLIRATRSDPRVDLGASPRAGLALVRTARAMALLRGRDYVLPDDVKALASIVLGHRLIISADARLRGVHAGEVVAEALSTTPVPLAD